MNKAECRFDCTEPEDCDGSCHAVRTVGVVRPANEGKRMPPSFLLTPEARITRDHKDTNPKDAIGSAKLPLHLVPDTLQAFAALAFAEGASKYGAYNWRAKGARASVYVSALRRHLAKWWNGEDADEATGVPHLASAAACIAVLIDVSVANRLVDDRPPALADLPGDIDGWMTDLVARVRELNARHDPHHWTIKDSLE